MMEVLNSLASRAADGSHPLLEERGARRILLVVVTADKGLCGGFNANIIRAAARFIEDRRGHELSLDAVGRKARDYFRRRAVRIRSEHVGVFQALRYSTAQAIARELTRAYTEQETDQVWLIYNEFKSVIQQRVVVERLLPVARMDFDPREPALDYLYEPAPDSIFGGLLPKHVEVQVWRALLESAAAEHGARMAAMDSATNNASDMIDNLTLYMNKVRQAAITKEIIEVVSGSGTPA
jgi:F-type H+-transporting ATPase subunit gamma